VYQTAVGRHGDRTHTAESDAVRNRARYHCAMARLLQNSAAFMARLFQNRAALKAILTAHVWQGRRKNKLGLFLHANQVCGNFLRK